MEISHKKAVVSSPELAGGLEADPATSVEESGSPRLVDYLAASLAQLGVRHVFGVGGANIEDFYDSLSMRSDITAVVAKHEFGATTMADGYARSASRLGVVAATSGGGSLQQDGKGPVRRGPYRPVTNQVSP